MTHNEPVIYDKAFVESMPRGKCKISWGEGEQATLLSQCIGSAVRAVLKIGIGDCTILRLVVVTSNLQNEVAEWAKQLNETWRASSQDAAAQTFTWGDGQAESTYAVIILPECVALGLITDETKTKLLGTLIHELAHVHDYFNYRYKIGLEPIPQQGNLKSLRQFFARSLWGEYFAESIASPYYKGSYSSENIAHSVSLLRDAIKTGNNLSSVFNHFGRSLALLAYDRQLNRNDKETERFLEEINSISPEWKQIIQCLIDILSTSGLDLKTNTLDCIGEQIDNGFRFLGLEPAN